MATFALVTLNVPYAMLEETIRFYAGILQAEFSTSLGVSQARVGEVNFVISGIKLISPQQILGFDVSKSESISITSFLDNSSHQYQKIETEDGKMLRFKDLCGNLILLSIIDGT